MCPEAVELDFGDWVGQLLPGLADDSRWRAFNSFRSLSRRPAASSCRRCRRASSRPIARIRAAHPGEAVAIFSHGDVIRVRRRVLRRRAARPVPPPRDQARVHQLGPLLRRLAADPRRQRHGRSLCLIIRVRRARGRRRRSEVPQAAVVPFRTNEAGEVEVLLIRRRRVGGWGIPKGIIDPGHTAPRGGCDRGARGSRGRRGAAADARSARSSTPKFGRTCRVEVFGLRVTRVHDHYEEERLRERRWFPLADAVRW